MLKLFSLWLLYAGLSLSGFAAATFEEHWLQFRTAARNGNWVLAKQFMEGLELEFKGDPLYESAVFQRAYLPLRVVVLMEQQQFQQASYALFRFMETNGIAPRQLAWARFTQARLAHAMNRFEEALEKYAEFSRLFPEITESHLTHWFMAELHLHRGDSDAAIASLTILAESTKAPEHLRKQARIRRLQIALEAEKLESCLQYLDDLQLPADGIPEKLAASFTALRLQQFLRENGEQKASLRASFSVRSHSKLATEFEEYFEALRRNWAMQQAHWNRRAPIWAKHLEQRVASAQRSLLEFRDTDPFTVPWLLGRGLSFLEADHPWLANRTFELLLSNAETVKTVPTADLLYLSILCLQELLDWNKATGRIERFYTEFADDPRLPSVRFAQARGEFLQGNSEPAKLQLDLLIRDFPEHAEVLSWRWLRAQVLMDLAQHNQAFSEFHSIHEKYQQHRLIPYILLNAVESAFGIHQDDTAHRFLEHLENHIDEHHHLLPYSRWIRIQLAFRRHDHPGFIGLRNHFLRKWQDHPLVPELINLSGDQALRSGDWQKALSWYERVPRDFVQAYEYACFQKVTVFRHTDQAGMAWHVLNDYVQEALKNGPTNRLREAVFSLNSLAGILGLEAQWRIQLENLVSHFGNLTQLDDFSSYLQIWQQTVDAESNENFTLWLHTALDESWRNGRLTLWSRLQLFRHPYQPRGESNAAEAMLLRLHQQVSLTDLDAQGLFRIGKLLLEQGFEEGADHMDVLITRYPVSHWTPKALKVLAEKGDVEDWRARRLWTQILRDWPATEEALWANLEIARLEAADSSWAEAVERLGKLIEMRSAPAQIRSQAWFYRAHYLIEMNEIAEAIHHFQRLYSLFPQYTHLCAKAYLKTAGLLIDSGQMEHAREVLSEALAVIDETNQLHREIAKLKKQIDETGEQS